MTELLPLLKPALAGFVLFNVATHPKSSVWNRLPKTRFKNSKVQIFPSIRLLIRDKIIHLHHWFSFAVLLGISAIFNVGFLDHNLTQGLMLGGMLQGLSDPTSRRLIYKKLPESLTYHNQF